MSEADDSLGVEMNGEPFSLDRSNTTLYTFVGAMSVYNHIFITTTDDPEDPAIKGGFIFANLPPDNPIFRSIATFIVDHEFPMILNMGRVPDCDQDAFMSKALADVEDSDSFPEGWET